MGLGFTRARDEETQYNLTARQTDQSHTEHLQQRGLALSGGKCTTRGHALATPHLLLASDASG
eukprot:9630186-Alexandrium_andersonii.AAC.1